MLSFARAFYELRDRLSVLYDEREATAISHELLEHITGLTKAKRLIEKDTLLTPQQQRQFDHAAEELLKGRPFQYVTGRAWFMGREFLVNEHVLIPRPETEELVDWIVTDNKMRDGRTELLDIGTGNGCIAISLSLALPGSVVVACDISGEALAVADANAKRLGANISFVEIDFMNREVRNKLGQYDVIVSNPPYIPEKDKTSMHENVKNWEPASALFVPDDDPLVFYKVIADFGRAHLKAGSYIYCELDAAHAFECKSLFEATGYKAVEIRKDMHGNWRMLRCHL